MIKFLFFSLLLISPLLAQKTDQTGSDRLFGRGNAWESVLDFRADSVDFYEKGTLVARPIKSVISNAGSIDTLITNQYKISRGGGDISISYSITNLAGTMEIMPEIGIHNGLGYTYYNMLTAVQTTDVATNTYNIRAQTWGTSQIPQHIIIRFKESTTNQQNKIIVVINHFHIR